MPKLRKSRSVLQALKRSAAWVIAFLMIIPMSLNLQAAPDREGWGDLVAAFAELSSFSTDVPHWTAQDQVVPVGQEYVDLTIMLDWGNVTPAHIGIALITLSFEPIAFTHESSSIILPEGVAGSLQRTPPSVLPVEPPLAVQAFQLVGLGGIVGPGHLGYVGLNVRLNIEDGFLANPGDSIEIGMLLAAMQGFPANQTHVTITRGALPTFDILYQGNPQEGGTVANLPANQMDLIAGSHPLTPGAAPTHSSVVRDGVLTSVVFEGWTSAPTNQIFTQENLPSRITTVTIEDGNVNVYAVWSWGVPLEHLLTVENLGMARPANQRPIGGLIEAGADLRPWTPGTPAAGSGLEFRGWVEPGHGLQIGQQAPPLTDEVWITPPTHMPAADLTVIAVWVCEEGYIGGRLDPNEYRLTVENLGMARPANQRPIGGMVAVGADLRPWTPGTPAAGSGLQFRGWVEPDHGLQIGQQAPPLTDEVWITPPTHMPANNLTVIAVWVCEDGYIGGRPDPNEYRLTVENLGMARPANQRPIGGMVAVGADLRPWTPGTPAAGSGLQFRGWVEPGHGLQIGQQAPPLTDEVWITPPTHMPATDLTVIAVWVCGDGYIGGRPDDNDVAVDVDDEGNVTITPPVDGSDSDLDDDGNITITLPDTDEGDVSVNVPDDWTYDKQQDGDDVIIVVTPANRPLVVNNFVMPRPTNQTPVSNETVRALSVIGPWAEGTPEPGWHFLGWARTNANLNVGQPFPEGDRVPVAQLPHRMPNAGYTVWAVWGDRDGNVGQPDRMDLTVSNVGMARPTDQRPISTPYVTVGTAIGPWVEGTPQLGFVFLGWAGTDERLIIGQRFPEADRIPANQLPNYMPTEDVRVWAVWGNDEGYIGLRNTRPLTVRNAPVAVTTTGQTPVTNLTQEVTSILTWNPGTAAPPEPEASWTFLGWTDTAGRGQLVVGQRPPAGLLMSTQAIQVALPSMPNIAVTRYAVWGDDEGRFGIPNPPPVGGGPDIDINVDDDGNVTTNPPNLPYDRDNDGIITIPLPPGTDPGDVNVNVPGDDWDYDIVEDEDGNWKVVITPPFRNLVVTNLPSQITRPTNQRPVSGQFRVGARIVENVAGWIPGTPPTGWHFLGWASTNQGLVVGEPVPDGIRIPAAQLPTRMLGDGVRVYALWGDGEGRFGQPDPPPVGDPTFTLTYVANAQQNGTVTNMPANRDGLAPGAHGLGNVVPRHTPVNRNGVSTHVVFRGWSAAPANQIFAHGATLPTLLTEVTITDANVRVYAVWGWGEPVAPGDDKRQVPKTGDQSNMLLWMMLFGLGLLGFAATSTKLVIGRTNKEKPRVIIIEDAYNKEHHIIK